MIKIPYFETSKQTIFSPNNPVLDSFYKLLEKYAPVLQDSPIFNDLVETYEFLNFLLKEQEDE